MYVYKMNIKSMWVYEKKNLIWFAGKYNKINSQDKISKKEKVLSLCIRYKILYA